MSIIKKILYLIISGEIMFFASDFIDQEEIHQGKIQQAHLICAPYNYCIYQFRFTNNKFYTVKIPKEKRNQIQINPQNLEDKNVLLYIKTNYLNPKKNLIKIIYL